MTGTEGVLPHEESDPRPHVVVVGGGVAGLVAARELAGLGIRVTLFEASGRLGGKVHRHSVAGIPLDAGAESFATRGGTVVALLDELGLGDRVVLPEPRGAWLLTADGRAVPLPAAGLLGIPSVPLARDVIAVVGLAGALRAQVDSLLSGFIGSRSTDLGTLVRKRMGRAVLERLVAPITLAVHSSPPEQLALSVVAPRLAAATLSEGSLARAVLTLRAAAPAGSAVLGLDGGIALLVEALARDIEGRVTVRLGEPVRSTDDAGVLLEDGTHVASDHVVLAAELGEQSGRPITLATLVVDLPELDAAPRGSGVIVTPGAPEVRAKALTHATAKWEWLRREAAGRHVLRLSYETAPDDLGELRELARSDAEALLGVRIPAASVLAVERRDWRGPGTPGPVEQPGRVAASGPVDRPHPPTRAADRRADDSDDPDVAPSEAPGSTLVGERISGAGLAGAIASARTGAQAVAARVIAAHGIRFTDLES